MSLSIFKDALDSCEIYAVLKKHKNTKDTFINVFSWDTVPTNLSKKRFSLVCNLSKSNNSGTHWIAVFSNGKTLEIFDSFALIGERLTNSKLEQLSKKLKLKIKTNKKRLQSLYSDTCGHYCLGYIIFKSKGYCLTSFNRLFSHSDFITNDDSIKQAVEPLIRKSTKQRYLCYQRYLLLYNHISILLA